MREGETKKNSEDRLERLRFAPFPYDLNLTRSSIARANWLVTLGRFPSRCGSDRQAHLTAAKLLHDTTHPPHTHTHTHSSLLPSLSSSHFTTPSFIPLPLSSRLVFPFFSAASVARSTAVCSDRRRDNDADW